MQYVFSFLRDLDINDSFLLISSSLDIKHIATYLIISLLIDIIQFKISINFSNLLSYAMLPCYCQSFLCMFITIFVLSLRHPGSSNRTFNILQVSKGLCMVLSLFPVLLYCALRSHRGLLSSSFFSPSVRISLFILQTSP